MATKLPPSLMVLGAVLLVCSVGWPMLFPSSAYWKEADETKLEEMQSRVHNLSYLVAQAEEQPDPRKNRMSGEEFVEYRELKVETQKMFERRDNAIARPKFIANILRWSGIGGLLVGIVVHYALRDE